MKTHIFPGMIAIMMIAIMSTGCKKTYRTATGEFATAARRASLCDCSTITIDTLAGVISSDLTLDHCTEYRLSRLVFVSNNATLTIEPGTRIEGLPGTGSDPGGGLIITRGSRIIADGTEECPIVFTSYRWDGTGANAPASGDWSGVILLGYAPVNAVDPMIEGIPDYPAADANYGGDQCNDTSGILRYVRIEYAGYELTTDNEINGLTLGGVGCGTVIDHVAVYKSRDDAFQFFGGTVNATHLVAIDPLDDLFDFEFGYQGHIQFALGLADTSRADVSQSNGIESDNNNTPPYAAIPQTLPVLSNLTIIGVPDSLIAVSLQGPFIPPSGSYGRAAHIRRNSGIIVSNSIFMGFKWGISLDGSGSQNKMLAASPVSCFENNLVQAFSIPFKTENASGTWMPGSTNTSYLSYTANDDIKLVNPFVREAYNFAMLTYESPALAMVFHPSCLSGGCCNFSFRSTSGYIGSFADGDQENWAQDIIYGGWVRYREPMMEMQLKYHMKP